ncbi:MAG: DUF2306 domain-containing protein [Bacteroidota bacterium]
MSRNTAYLFNQKYTYFLLGVIVVLSVPFAIYAFQLSKSGFSIGLAEMEVRNIPLNQTGNYFSNQSLSLHFILGALLTLLAPIQVMLGWSRKAMIWHKWLGFLIVGAGILTGLGGLLYILLNGTIGGTVMNIAFAGYGLLMVVSAIKSGQYARNKQLKLHEEWSMRLFILAVGSWVYRLGYGMVLAQYPDITETIGEFAVYADFRGPFDYFMDFSFYLLPLLGLEFYFKYAKKRAHPLLVSSMLLLITCFFIYGFWGFFGV